MNWHIFSIIGYLGAALCLSLPVLWLVYWRCQKPRLRHIAIALTLVAFVCAKVNSATHVNRIKPIPAEPVVQLESREQAIRQAALQGRSEKVAQVFFAEDSAGDFLDRAGMDEADLKYLDSGNESAIPEWKRQKQSRSQDASQEAAPEEKLSAQIDSSKSAVGVNAEVPGAPNAKPALLMTEADVTTARRLDRWSLGVTRFLILAAALLLAVDYLRRANNYGSASLPLRIPSIWLNSFTPVPAQVVRPQTPRRTIPAELEWLANRGDSFVYLTDNPADADAALAHLESRPKRRSAQVLRVTDAISDEFVFECLWFCRGSFVVDSAARAGKMLETFIERLEQRRAVRARVGQTAHIVYDVNSPIPETKRRQLVKLAQATGFSLFICHDSKSTT